MNTRLIISGILVTALVLVSGCGFQPPPITALWADVHPQGWVVFTGSRPPFPPPTRDGYYVSYDDKLLLFHPHLGTTITFLEDSRESFSWPRWLSTLYSDELYWIGNQQKIYRMTVNLSELEGALADPLQIRLPMTLQDAKLLWADESGTISALAPSPDGKFVAFLREHERQFAVVILDIQQDPVQKVAELPTVWLPNVIWTADGQSVLLAREDPNRSFSPGDLSVGEIVRHVIATGEEIALAGGVVFYRSDVSGPGPMALSGSTLYYTNLVTLRPRTAKELRLGLYRVDLDGGPQHLLMELSLDQTINEIAVSPSGRRVAFTLASYRAGVALAIQSSLWLSDGHRTWQLAQLVNGWLFPLWLDDDHLVYVQFQVEAENQDLPMGVRPALWVHNVETGERSNYLPLLATQMQIDALRQAVQRLQERLEALEKTVQELQSR